MKYWLLKICQNCQPPYPKDINWNFLFDYKTRETFFSGVIDRCLNLSSDQVDEFHRPHFTLPLCHEFNFLPTTYCIKITEVGSVISCFKITKLWNQISTEALLILKDVDERFSFIVTVICRKINSYHTTFQC